jgi:hypothetical protein
MNKVAIACNEKRVVAIFWVIACTAMAAGMGWGIRGQYGHETGAMIAGALTSLVIVMFFIPDASSLTAARVAAMMTVAIGIGGTMTYGQTVGLTHDRDLVGNWEALRWGLLGLFVKGGLWIGLAGTFLGMGLGGTRYRSLEMLLLMVTLIGLIFVGIRLINSPYDPASRVLPKIYFSGSWYFQPNKVDLKPRQEVWGGLLFAWLGLLCYISLLRRDVLALRMGLIGFISGGLGFSGGQCVQAFHAWNADLFSSGALSQFKFFNYFNWWNMMETSFGLIFGTGLAIGLWMNRSRICPQPAEDYVSMSATTEVSLIATHLILLMSSEFIKLPGWASLVSHYTNFGLIMCVIPLVGIVGGRLWPYVLLLTVVAAPICGKQLRALCYSDQPLLSWQVGWLIFGMIPIGVTVVVATWSIDGSFRQMAAQRFAAVALSINTLLYFGLNTYFFNFAWPWDQWTGRTPNQIIFMVCALCLLSAAVTGWLRSRPGNAADRVTAARVTS